MAKANTSATSGIVRRLVVSAASGVAVLAALALLSTARASEKLVAPPVVSQEKPMRAKPGDSQGKTASGVGKEIPVSDGKGQKGECSARDGVLKRCRKPDSR